MVVILLTTTMPLTAATIYYVRHTTVYFLKAITYPRFATTVNPGGEYNVRIVFPQIDDDETVRTLGTFQRFGYPGMLFHCADHEYYELVCVLRD